MSLLFSVKTILFSLAKIETWLSLAEKYSQLSPCRHLAITVTAEVPGNKKSLKTTPAITDFLYYAH